MEVRIALDGKGNRVLSARGTWLELNSTVITLMITLVLAMVR